MLAIILTFSLIFVLMILIGGLYFFIRQREESVASDFQEDIRQLETNKAVTISNAPLTLPLPARLKDESIGRVSKKWKNSMQKIGQILEEQGVGHIILIHGTFAGDDPLDIFSHSLRPQSKMAQWWELHFPGLHPIKQVQSFYRQAKDKVIGNIGNFTPRYVSTLEKGLQSRIKVHRLHWPSGNHHLARIRGLLALIDLIIQLECNGTQKMKILLVGHSHAGQLFAALSQVCARPGYFSKILKEKIKVITDSGEFEKNLEKINQLSLDFATWGSAPRYKWQLNGNCRLVHLLNFRKLPPRFPNLWKLISAGYGDTVYLLAGPGSDSWAPYKKDRHHNKVLDSIFGVGGSIKHWWSSIRSGLKMHNQGQHFLIDYHDAGISRFFHSFLGHGIYTHPGLMLFNFQIMVRGLYKIDDDKMT